ncbi:hypothetical protein CRYUN_Cryun15aG0046400 [Craigia yunnanensis]
MGLSSKDYENDQNIPEQKGVSIMENFVPIYGEELYTYSEINKTEEHAKHIKMKTTKVEGGKEKAKAKELQAEVKHLNEEFAKAEMNLMKIIIDEPDDGGSDDDDDNVECGNGVKGEKKKVKVIMKCAATVVVGYRPLLRPICLASNPKINTEQLRYQLDQLHAEAETTRAKASNARLRFLRLSEAAEKLRRQAAVSIQRGKENEARDLLFQKKKVIQALEKSKSRIELMDKLSTKLIETITFKETLLIGNIASDSEISGEDDSSPVWVISPKERAELDKNKNKDFGNDALALTEDQKLLHHTDDLVEQPANEELEEHQAFPSSSDFNEENINSSLATISTYEDFLEHLNQQLNKIEQELITILNVSTLLLDDEKPQNLKVQQTTELLESILDVRQRITNIRQMKIEIS